jgi:hypothetical protein
MDGKFENKGGAGSNLIGLAMLLAGSANVYKVVPSTSPGPGSERIPTPIFPNSLLTISVLPKYPECSTPEFKLPNNPESKKV